MLAALLIAGCSFTSYNVVVNRWMLLDPADTIASTSVDGSTLFTVDKRRPGEPRELRAFDAQRGTLVGNRTSGQGWGVRAVAPAHAPGYEDAVWALYENGYRVRWNRQLTNISGFEVPIPSTGEFAVNGRVYCDMDRDSDGASYVTVVDNEDSGFVSRLYVERNGDWTRTELDPYYSKCTQVSYDPTFSRAVVLRADRNDIRWFDKTDLSLEGELDISGFAGAPMDIAAAIGVACVMFKNATGSYEVVEAIHLASGDSIDQFTLPDGSAIALQLPWNGNDEAFLWWTGWDGDKYAAGNYEIE